ncbi:MXAN_5187 family protein [Polyangium sorediatum]|uniref:MXAN_5187 family protein n=1 Tax=Polyangium sorediatum TaxID=889274 RepID=A0ABT6NHY9_9BACT|nr:MXAN_5187 family protein [Polyangium sorediatum]MDI1427919.1 MXAN_5187 family protein [Polyangium sorediatum]
MILSRFWYLALAILLGVSAFTLMLAAQMYNRSGLRAMSDSLAADSSAVGWYLKDDARNRSSALIPIALAPELRGQLAKATPEAKPSREIRDEAKKSLKKLDGDVPAELKFDALWAVDGSGRVIASVGIEHAEDWELGGYPVVADALHGWIRDDAWVWKGRIYRVVARPVEAEVNGEPVGAVIGVKIVDDKFAQGVSKRTGSAVGFYADGARVASWAPEGFDKANLDQITQDLKQLEDNKDYQEKGRSEPRVIASHLGVVYARMPGEAWDLGAGYAVGRLAVAVDSPLDFLNKADDTDKKNVPTIFVIAAILALAGVGVFFSVLEHTQPLATFGKEAIRLAKGEVDVLAPSKFRGAYKKIASDVNDGIDKIAAKGGAPRRAADLEQVLGPIPAAPTMSAFAVPGPGETSSTAIPVPNSSPSPAKPLPKALPKPKPRPGSTTQDPVESIPEPEPEAAPAPAAAPPPLPKAAAAEPAAPAAEGDEVDELTEWQKVYEEFVAMKQQCGEQTAGMTFEKFKSTLQRNKDALVQRHGVTRVKFTVYAKEGKAALKASPVNK